MASQSLWRVTPQRRLRTWGARAQEHTQNLAYTTSVSSRMGFLPPNPGALSQGSHSRALTGAVGRGPAWSGQRKKGPCPGPPCWSSQDGGRQGMARLLLGQARSPLLHPGRVCRPGRGPPHAVPESGRPSPGQVLRKLSQALSLSLKGSEMTTNDQRLGPEGRPQHAQPNTGLPGIEHPLYSHPVQGPKPRAPQDPGNIWYVSATHRVLLASLS